MKRFNLILVAALVLALAGGAFVTHTYAGEGCSAHATSKTVEATDAAKAQTASADGKSEATATKANATSTSAACCASHVKTASAETVKAGATCSYAAGAKTAGTCEYSAANAKFAKGELMDGEATMAKLAHCGIDCRGVDVEYLSAKLASGKCGSYTQEQWATMIRSAQKLDAEKAEAVFANAKSGAACKGDACPMTLVANELKAEKESHHN